MTRRVSKFGGGVSTPPLVARIALTAATLALGGMLVVRIIRETSDSHLELAGFVFFLLGVWFVASVVFLPHLWRASGEWKREQYQAHRLERRLRIALEPSRRPDLALARARTAYCPVCGQNGPAPARSRTVCSACQRPWAAGSAMPAPVLDTARPPSVIDLRDRVATHR
jgi:hypothetical protein